MAPFPESALNEDAAKLYMENYKEYEKHAKLLTELYAFQSEKGSFIPPVKNTISQIETFFGIFQNLKVLCRMKD